MANEHLILCGSARLTSTAQEWRNAPTTRLPLGDGRSDVHLKIDHVTKRMCAGMPDLVTDLLEFAAYVYVADQMISRGGAKEFEYGERWRRHFRLEVPVRCPSEWQRPDVKTALGDALNFLSDDYSFEFGFSKLRNPRPLEGYLYDETPLAKGDDFQEVILFSGGLDALGGAVQEILQGQRRVALVSHRPVSKLYSRQRALATEIAGRVPDWRKKPLHVAVEVNKGRSLTQDFTQRTRSFLFASLGAVVARILRLSRVRFYENGIVSMNLPVSPQVLGGRATRTTHPRTLEHFGRFFSLLFGSEFTIENPFSWLTKSQILSQIRAAGYGKLCAMTSSCTHTLLMTTEHSHCGRCTQCLDRRISALAAGLDESEDPPDKYASDVLIGPRKGADLILCERYHGRALQIQRIPDSIRFVSAFPEVARLLSHVGLPTAQAVDRIFEVHKRHAADLFTALSNVVQAESAAVVQHAHPANCFLSIALRRTLGITGVTDRGMAGPTASQQATANQLQVDATDFTARLGAKCCPLGNTNEFAVLARLNHSFGRYVSIDALRTDVWQNPHTEKYAIQRTISNVRRKLKDARITEVVILCPTRDHYRLVAAP